MFDSVRKKGELEVESKNDKSFYETHQISYEDECGENKLMKVIFNKIEKWNDYTSLLVDLNSLQQP